MLLHFILPKKYFILIFFKNKLELYTVGLFLKIILKFIADIFYTSHNLLHKRRLETSHFSSIQLMPSFIKFSLIYFYYWRFMIYTPFVYWDNILNLWQEIMRNIFLLIDQKNLCLYYMKYLSHIISISMLQSNYGCP